MDQAHLFAIGVLLAWLAGIRVYLTVFGVGLAGFFGWLDLPQALQAAQSPWVLGTSGVLAAAEFFADKIPGVDSVWDLLHTLLRVPAGAFLAAAALSPDGQLGAGMLATGAGVALTSHQVGLAGAAEHLAGAGQQLDRLGGRGRRRGRRPGARVQPSVAGAGHGGRGQPVVRPVRVVALAPAVPARTAAAGRVTAT